MSLILEVGPREASVRDCVEKKRERAREIRRFLETYADFLIVHSNAPSTRNFCLRAQ